MPEICTFTLTLTEAAPVACSVHYATQDGTAKAGTDYTAKSGTLAFAVGERAKTVIVDIQADITALVDKSFTMLMSVPNGLSLASKVAGVGIISTAGDAPVDLTVQLLSVTVSDDDAPPIFTALSALGSKIVDASGATLVLHGINWYGYDGTDLLPHGMYTNRPYNEILDQMKQLGFNHVRIPFSDDMLTSTVVFNSVSGDQYVGTKNADLIGLTPLQSLPVIIRYGASIGLRFVLDHHRISMLSSGAQDPSGFGTDGWPAADPLTGTYLYGGSAELRPYTAATWLNMWKALATFCTTGVFATDPLLKNAIAGFDPHNEPRNLDWATWAGMVEALAPEVLAIAPDWLCFVEGVGKSADKTINYWDGGYLRDARARPINLGIYQNKLVYSAHDYGQSVFGQTWLSSRVQNSGGQYPVLINNVVPDYPANLEAVFRENWGFLVEENIAPVWVGEYGGGLGLDYATGLVDPLQTNADYELEWLNALVAYMLKYGVSSAYFSANPESGPPLGGLLLNSDYTTVHAAKMDALLPLLSQFEDA